MQTPLNEEKGRKRDREEDTPVSGLVEQPETKKQRVDPLPEEEVIEEIINSQRSKRAASQLISLETESPITSHGQKTGKKPIMEISLVQPQSKQEAIHGDQGTK